RAEIPADEALDFYAWADSLGLLYDCYRDNWGYMSADMREAVLATITDAGVKKLIETLRTPVPELNAYLREKGTGVQKLQLYFSDLNLRARLLNELPQRFPKLAFSSSMPFNIEINAPDATKGCALLTLCTLLGVDPRDTMALGDGTNDLDMIQKAGIGVAMGNAAPSVLAAADYVTGHCDDTGFAKAVYKFC
ncbi:MAG: HAD hydrolase family protein, partial [Oscillospiraceae bacterium]|nr:HAD hydrolase family protein [Oscillospiraceae bacterium]